MNKLTPKKVALNLYGWWGDRSFGKAITLPFIRVRHKTYPTTDLFSVSVGRDDQYLTLGMNLVYRVPRSKDKQLSKGESDD